MSKNTPKGFTTCVKRIEAAVCECEICGCFGTHDWFDPELNGRICQDDLIHTLMAEVLLFKAPGYRRPITQEGGQ